MNTEIASPSRVSRRTFVLAAALLAGACAAPRHVRHVRPSGRVHVVVLHTNDMHGQVQPRKATWLSKEKPPLVGGLPRVAEYVARTRREETANGAAVLVLDAGDWYQGTPEGVLDRGLPLVTAIAAIGYDAACLGNHDFDHGLANVKRLLAQAQPPAVCANLREPASGARVDWVDPWTIVEARGLRFALVGLLTPATPSITHADARQLVFNDPLDELARVERELEGKYDVLIPIGHLGVDDGVRLARANPELPLVVTAHSHTLLAEGLREGSTLVVQAGGKATCVGRVDLWIDGPSATVLESKAQLVELRDEPSGADRNLRVEALCAELVARADAAMRATIGELRAPLTPGGAPFSTVAGSWVADLIRERAGAQVAFHNRGGTRAAIGAGPVTLRDVFEMLPFDNDVVRLTLSGAQLEALVRTAIEGTQHAGLDYSGLVAFVRSAQVDGRTRLTLDSIEVGGAPLDPAASYSVGTNSFLAGGADGFDELGKLAERHEDPILLRELAAEVFQRVKVVTPPTDARIVELDGSPQQ